MERTADRDPRSPLVTRLAARISASLDEIAPYTTIDLAEEALATRCALGRRIGLALSPDATLGQRARTLARTTTDFTLNDAPSEAVRASTTLDALISLANNVDTLFLEAPLRRPIQDASCSGWTSMLTPRELLTLRARAPRTLLVLDLRNEDFARTPLTQSALLLPGTLILRGFGELWASQGATLLARSAFIAGPSSILESLQVDTCDLNDFDRLVVELDAPDLDRRVQESARKVRAATSCVLSPREVDRSTSTASD